MALLYAFARTRWVSRQDTGTDVIRELSGSIAEGARAFLNREYRVLAVFVVVVAIILGFVYSGRADSSWLIALAFIAGGVWDNARKRIESDTTVGDPLKDTSGPSLNILIKLVAVVSLVIAPLIAVAPADVAQDEVSSEAAR